MRRVVPEARAGLRPNAAPGPSSPQTIRVAAAAPPRPRIRAAKILLALDELLVGLFRGRDFPGRDEVPTELRDLLRQLVVVVPMRKDPFRDRFRRVGAWSS